MAAIVVDVKEVRPVVAIHQVIGPVLPAADIKPGQVLEWDANGNLIVAAANSVKVAGIALSDSQVSGKQMTCLRKGIVNLGATALDAANFGDPVGITAGGGLDTTAGTGDSANTRVVPAWGSRPTAGGAVADKLLSVDF